MIISSVACLAALAHIAAGGPAMTGSDPVWNWPTASPDSQGMSGAGLDAAAACAQKYGGGSGCIIRHGYLLKEWGSPTTLADIKSATKGSVGATVLGLAVDAGLVRLDDPAQKHYPGIGAETPDNGKTGRLGEVTVRHLATMTAGFDDGRPPRLVYRPGATGVYSNDTSNMLAELLTLVFKEDLRALLKRRVMDPLGISPSEWAWRDNAYRADAIQGIKSREFASGITITHRALAQIGYLYLREGVWNGKRILSKEFIRAATRPADLPGPFPGYGFYWISNAKGAFPGIPTDAYWALGLGDSFVLVCPSLDLVVVRLGTGSRESQLPGEEGWGGDRVAGFFRLVVKAVHTPPYPPSPVIREIKWAPASSIVRAAQGSDRFVMTWADDDAQYTSWCDGNGFSNALRLSLGFARVTGPASGFRAEDIRSPSGEDTGDGPKGHKASGLLAMDGTLYMWVSNADKDGKQSRLAWSGDHARTWTWADWRFEEFGYMSFVNYGRDYAGARDGYVYMVAHDHLSAYRPADRFVLMRVDRRRIRVRAAYAFFARLDGRGKPQWTTDIRKRGAVFTNPGRCLRSQITYNAGLKRYLWWQQLPRAGAEGNTEDTRFEGGFGVYDAPEPWGPWTTAFFTERWDVGPGETAGFPAKWMSADGKTLYLVFSGEDCFSVRKAILVLRAEGEGVQ